MQGAKGVIRGWLIALRAHQSVVEAEKVQPLTPDVQVHDPGLGLLGLEPKIGQQDPQPL
jgi:hypothetical protein